MGPPESAAPPARTRSWSRRVQRWLLLGLAAYGVILIVLMALENRLVYRGSSAEENWVAAPFSPVQDVFLKTSTGVTIHAWWCPYREAEGALLYCHGNAGNLSHRGQSLMKLQQLLKQSVLIFDYPGYGKSSGSPTEQGCYAAADAAYNWLTLTERIPAERILLYGSSLGGGVAIDLASRRPHRALVVDKTFTSMPDVAQQMYPWVPVRWLMHNRYDNLSKIKQCHRPVFIGHGCADDLIPFAHGERLFAAANEPKHFFRAETCGHNDPMPKAFFDELREFLGREATKQIVAD